MYEERIRKLLPEDFFHFFNSVGAQPQWVNSNGKNSIQVLGLCHHGSGHSVVFDPSTGKATCYSLCGTGMFFHTWVKRALNLSSVEEAKEYIEKWIDTKIIDIDERVFFGEDFSSCSWSENEKAFKRESILPVPPIKKEILQDLYSNFDTSLKTLKKLSWHTKDKIDVFQLSRFNVAYNKKRDTIILPHHNINGEIVGLYERNFSLLRKDAKQYFPQAPYSWLCQFPRAKYLPLLKEEEYRTDEKNSWSFPNSQNLYGLHLAKDSIKKYKRAIIFEGAKSVMLAHQYGFPYSVASHTFGANDNHINMLLDCGAKEIIFAFDKQYEEISDIDGQWALYEKKTSGLAKRIKDFADVSRIIDFNTERDRCLNYKDSPIDQGKKTFLKLFSNRQRLFVDGEEQESNDSRFNKTIPFKEIYREKIIPKDDEIFLRTGSWARKLSY